MTDSPPSHSVLSANEESLQTLVRAIQLSTGQFSLILARCNYRSLRERMMQQLRELSPVPIQTMTLPEGAVQLFTAIKAEVGNNLPSALMVFGLEAVNDLDTVLTSANQVREEFRNRFAFSLVLWINDDILQKLIRLAPDLKSWSTTIEFLIATDELTQLIQQTADDVFAKVLDSRENVFLDNAALDLKGGSPHRLELQAAYKQLKTLGTPLEADLEASLEFVLGRVADNSKTDSREHYERSLALWRQTIELETNETTTPTTNPKSKIQNPKSQERLGHTFFYLGLWWRNHAERHLAERPPALEQAKSYFQQALDGFEQTNRPNLAAKYINFLAETLHRLQDWDQLARVANKALTLHKNHSDDFRQARAYGFLAETALAKSDWTEAQQAAQQALSLMKESEDSLSTASPEQSAFLEWERSFHQSWYLFSLAKAQQQLEQPEQALKTLETAKAFAKPHYDPELYIAILGALRESYFQRGDYLTAFEIRQTKREIESQFGYRAFIGAGRLQAKKKVANPALPAAEPAGIVAEEIAASGRQQDVNRLIERMGRDDCKLTVIHGQSGVGKSSMLQAGFIPALTPQAINARNGVVVLQQIYTNWTERLGQRLLEALTGLSNGLALPESANSTTAILEQLRQNVDHNLLTILVFDQFEEFFFIYKDPVQRKPFYDFLRECINTPYVKVILSLREDYLHYLLECNRLESLEIIDNNILDKNILFYLGNFTSQDARSVIQSLTNQTQFLPDEALVNALVKDLTKELGEVRPIELQVVGAQLQTENIATLVQYQEKGPKEALVGRFLEEVVKDCGPENEQIAKLVLYLLTDENHTRPLKTRADLELELDVTAQKLDLVLAILVKSRLIFQIPASPADRYQLVHDYLVAFVRQQQSARLIAEIEKEREQRRLTEARLNEVLRQQLEETRKSLFWKVGLAAIAGGLALVLPYIWTGQNNSYLRELATESERLLSSNKDLEALKIALKAGRRLNRWWSFGVENNTRIAVTARLQDTIYGSRLMNTLEGHGDNVTSVRFSPDGQYIVSGSDDETVKIWNLEGKELTTLKGHEGAITCVAMSRDNKLAVSGSSDKTVKLWTFEGEEIRTFEGHNENVSSIAISPNAKTVISGSESGELIVWEIQDGIKVELDYQLGNISQIVFDESGTKFATTSEDGEVVVWNLYGEKLITVNHGARLSGLVLRDEFIISLGLGIIKLWDMHGHLIRSMRNFTLLEEQVSYSVKTHKIVTSIREELHINHADTSDYFWQNYYRNSGEYLKGHQNNILDLDINPEGNLLISAGADKTIRVWNLLRQFEVARKREINQVNASSFDKVLTTSENKAHTWSTFNNEFEGISGDNIDLESTPQGLITANRQYAGYLLNFEGRTEGLLEGKIISPSLSRSSALAATIIDHHNGQYDIRIYNTETGELLTSLKEYQSPVYAVTFSNDNQFTATAEEDGYVKTWEINGNQVASIDLGDSKVEAFSFDSTSQFITVHRSDNRLDVYSVKGDLIREIKGEGDQSSKVKFSSNRQHISIITQKNKKSKLEIWDLLLSEKRVLQDYEQDLITKAEFVDNDQFLLVSAQGETQFWNLVDGTLVSTIEESYKSFSLDGQLLISLDDDGTAKIRNRSGNLTGNIKFNIPRQQRYRLEFYFSGDSRSVIVDNPFQKEIQVYEIDGKSYFSINYKDLLDDQELFEERISLFIKAITGSRKIAIKTPGDKIQIWSLDTKSLVKEYSGDWGFLENFYFANNNNFLLVSGGKYQIKLRNSDRHAIRTLLSHDEYVNGLALSPDSSLLAIASDDTAILQSLSDDSSIVLQGHEDDVLDVSFSPSGNFVATSGKDKTVNIWDTSGKLIDSHEIHTNQVNSVSFSPDGKFVVTSSNDKTLGLINLETGEFSTFSHDYIVTNAKFSPDGKLIYSATRKNINVWDLDGKLLASYQRLGHSDFDFIDAQSFVVAGGFEPMIVESDLDNLLQKGCALAKNYLANNPKVSKSDRTLCDNIISEESTLEIQPIGQTLQIVDLTDWFEDAKPNIHR